MNCFRILSDYDQIETGRVLLRNIMNFIVAVLYFLAAHVFDVLYFTVSNIYSYESSIVIMTTVLFTASTILVLLYDALRERHGWDILGMDRVYSLANAQHIEHHRIFKRLLRWTVRQGRWWIYFLGSCTIGPPVVTILLRQKGNWKSSFFYLSTGSLISVILWVSVWSGVGKFTWKQYLVPFFQTLANRI